MYTRSTADLSPSLIAFSTTYLKGHLHIPLIQGIEVNVQYVDACGRVVIQTFPSLASNTCLSLTNSMRISLNGFIKARGHGEYIEVS